MELWELVMAVNDDEISVDEGVELLKEILKEEKLKSKSVTGG